MGVLGLTPFLQRTCPEVIKQLPDRLRNLTGKTIVIDGTLITQRLHFAPVPHSHRHVLGWHRLVKELKDYGVRAICVFDGKERSLAKAGEIERRKHAHRMTVARGSVEIERLQRLQKLVGLYNNFSSLNSYERERATTLLRTMVWDPPNITPPLWNTASDFAGFGTEPLWRNIHQDAEWTYSAMRPDNPAHELFKSRGGAIRTPERPFSVAHDQQQLYSEQGSLPTFTCDECTPPLRDQIIYSTEDFTENTGSSHSAENISSAIASLYFDYFDSLPKLSCLSTSTSSSSPSPTSISSGSDVNLDQTEYAMTKTQYQLTLEESKLWSDLVGSSAASLHERSMTTSNLALLATKSSLMSESYQRRMNSPSTQTYEESKEILDAMGVPCVEPAGPYEAEALAASLVVNGLADYVASEDTDVLVYEAPLLRNLTNRQEPLTIVSGRQVRAVLQLNRAAYIDFALLLGTDFSQRIKNVGPTRALKFIREHGSIERVVEVETRYPPRIPRATYLEQVKVARLVFRTLPPVPDVGSLQSRPSDDVGVAEILQRHGLHRAAVYDGDYHTALDGNYFHDDPRTF